MKVLITALCAMLVLIPFVSCRAEIETGTLRVEIDNGKRTVSPEVAEMEVQGHRIVMTGPDGKERTPRYTYMSYINLEGLEVGKWNVKVYGFNKDRVDVNYGEKEVMVNSGKNTLRIEIDTLLGEGDLEIRMCWDSNAFPTAKSVSVSLKDRSGREISIMPSPVSGSSCIAARPSLPSGSYIFTAHLLDGGGNVLSGLAEALRISSSRKTAATLEFPSATAEGDGEADITVNDNTGLPIDASIIGVEALMEAGKSFTVSVSLPSSSPLTLSEIESIWFLDGRMVGKGSEFTFQGGVEEGIHRIDLVTSTDKEGSSGSKSVTFRAASSTVHGSPYQSITINGGSEWKMGQNTVMHFLPDHRLLVVSNQYRTVQLISVDGVRPVLDASFSFSSLGIDGDVADWGVWGEESDSYYSAIFLVNTALSCKAMNIIITGKEMMCVDTADNFDRNGGSNRATRFVNIAPANNVFLATIESNDKSRMGVVLFNMNPDKGKMVNRDNWYSASARLEWGFSGYKCVSSIPQNGFTCIASGQRSKIIQCVVNSTGTTSIKEAMMWVSFDDYLDYYNQNKVKAEFDSARSCGFVTRYGEHAFVFSPEAIYYFCDSRDIGEEFTLYHIQSLAGRNIGDVKMCADTLYGYMIDNDTHRLYTLNPVYSVQADGYVLEEGEWIEIGRNYADRLEISDSGEFIALSNSGDTSFITLVRTAR